MAGQRFNSGQVADWGRDSKNARLLSLASAPGITNRTTTSFYYWPNATFTSATTRAATANRLYIATATFTENVLLDRARISINTQASSSGQLARLGIYDNDANMVPQNLVSDFGTVDISSTGIKAITGLNVPLVAGTYSVCVVFQQACTPVYSRWVTGVSLTNNLASNSFTALPANIYSTFTFDSLPATCPAISNYEADVGNTNEYYVQIGWSLQ